MDAHKSFLSYNYIIFHIIPLISWDRNYITDPSVITPTAYEYKYYGYNDEFYITRSKPKTHKFLSSKIVLIFYQTGCLSLIPKTKGRCIIHLLFPKP